jgi:nucleoside phosphorylase
MKIVSTFAVTSEFAPWRRMRGFGRIDAKVYRAKFGETDVYAVITGIGMRAVASDFEQILRRSADVCIASGLAGGLKDQHRAGDVLVARRIKAKSDQTVMSDERLVECGVRCGATPVDFFQSVDTVVTSSPDKQRLSNAADAVDIESFSIMSRAQQCGVPAVAIRAVSDPVEQDMPIDFNQAIDDRGAIHWASPLLQIVKAPQRFPQFIRFGRDSLRAARNLATFLDRYVVEMA